MTKTKLGTFHVLYNNSKEYHLLKNEIFTKEQYYFETQNPQPHIIDLGANIGLSVLYFKKLYPHASILAVEPIQENLKLLEANVFENNLDNVEVFVGAVSPKEGPLEFYTNVQDNWHSTASHIQGNWTKDQPTIKRTVNSIQLSKLIIKPTDLIKIDIEGLEQAVLIEAEKKLHFVKHILCEFHPTSDQNLLKLVSFLEKLGFEVALKKNNKAVKARQATGLVLIDAKRA